MTAGGLRALALLHHLLLLSACARPAPPPDRGAAVQSPGDVTVRFGMVPSARAGSAAAPHEVVARDAHGSLTTGAARAHHLVMVVTGNGDSQPIAGVRAVTTVDVGGRMQTRVLEPMPANGAMSYGATFILPGPGRYVFTTQLATPGRAEPAQLDFVYLLAHGREP